MLQIELNELDLLKVVYGPVQDRLNFLVSEEIISKLDLKDIKALVTSKTDEAYKADNCHAGKMYEVIMLLQYIAYNRHKSSQSEEIATYVFDKLFEIISNDILS